ncbi:sialidase family protein [Paenibacillus hodogayensis]|uniref:Sialidase family protein n=1 Tax=Paenibacillus hodogayensis TaxID=279208 RepID=A0ABV5VV55_9BACL
MSAIRIIGHTVLYKDKQYNSFPSVVKLNDGSFLLGFRQAPERQDAYGSVTHVDTSSKAVTISTRDGVSWSGTADILWDDFFYGVQDPFLNVLGDGSLFATCFMWKVYERDEAPSRDSGMWHNVLGHWAARNVGCYTLRSADGGRTWDRPIAVSIPDMALRGNCLETDDGAILAPLYGEEDGTSNVVIGRTADRGLTWTRLATIPGMDGHHFHEPTLYRAPSGKLILFTRSRKKVASANEEKTRSPLYTAESLDGGHTWSEPRRHDIYSPSPFHLLPLRDGRVLLTYGYRYEPYGIRAIALDAECADLGTAAETVLREDGPGVDIGYTSSVQLDDGRVLVTYYYYDEIDRLRHIAGTYLEIVQSQS